MSSCCRGGAAKAGVETSQKRYNRLNLLGQKRYNRWYIKGTMGCTFYIENSLWHKGISMLKEERSFFVVARPNDTAVPVSRFGNGPGTGLA